MSNDADEHVPAPPEVSPEVQEKAKHFAGKGFVHHGDLYLSTVAGGVVKLASGVKPGDITDADVSRGASPDGKHLVFVRDVGKARYTNAADWARETELWTADTSSGEQHRLLTETPAENAKETLSGFTNAQFSPDNRFVFFETEAWPNAHAIHVIELATLKQRFVTRGTCMLVIPRGNYRGKLLFGALLYKQFPTGFHSYQWWGVADEQGKELRKFPEGRQECACCYFSSTEVRSKINKLLGIRETAAVRMDSSPAPESLHREP